MSTKLTATQSAILDRVQAALGQAARELLPADEAAEFESEMAIDRAARFDEPESDEERDERISRAEATHAYLQAMGVPQDALDSFRAGDMVASVSIELTPA